MGGVTTAALIASLVMSAAAAAAQGISSYMTAKAQSKALAAEGTERARQRDLRTKALAANQKASFLSSGIVLSGDQGETSGFVVNETYQHGVEDVGRIKSVYNERIKDTMAGGRMALISGLLLGVSFGAKAYASVGDIPDTKGGGIGSQGKSNIDNYGFDMDNMNAGIGDGLGLGGGSSSGYGISGSVE
jgi:hypothetical protein